MAYNLVNEKSGECCWLNFIAWPVICQIGEQFGWEQWAR